MVKGKNKSTTKKNKKVKSSFWPKFLDEPIIGKEKEMDHLNMNIVQGTFGGQEILSEYSLNTRSVFKIPANPLEKIEAMKLVLEANESLSKEEREAMMYLGLQFKDYILHLERTISQFKQSAYQHNLLDLISTKAQEIFLSEPPRDVEKSKLPSFLPPTSIREIWRPWGNQSIYKDMEQVLDQSWDHDWRKNKNSRKLVQMVLDFIQVFEHKIGQKISPIFFAFDKFRVSFDVQTSGGKHTVEFHRNSKIGIFKEEEEEPFVKIFRNECRTFKGQEVKTAAGRFLKNIFQSTEEEVIYGDEGDGAEDVSDDKKQETPLSEREMDDIDRYLADEKYIKVISSLSDL